MSATFRGNATLENPKLGGDGVLRVRSASGSEGAGDLYHRQIARLAPVDVLSVAGRELEVSASACTRSGCEGHL